MDVCNYALNRYVGGGAASPEIFWGGQNV